MQKEAVCPSASAKSTPVKSPEKKRTKTDDVKEQPPVVQKSLINDLDDAAAEEHPEERVAQVPSVSWIYIWSSQAIY